MSYSHTFYLKRNEHLCDGPDCPQVFWLGSQRSLSDVLRHYGTIHKDEDGIPRYTEMTFQQAFRMYKDIAGEIVDMFERLYKAKTQFEEEVLYNDSESERGREGLNSYAILYGMKNEVKDIHTRIFSEFNDEWPEYIAKRFIHELGTIIADMNADDILVYRFG